ncbi:hypothetical protein EV426DRAFT_571170 [Tirmania nivea]|nr:hypothetical protein EV426DRAFT_571170 [Tirmania nivea]
MALDSRPQLLASQTLSLLPGMDPYQRARRIGRITLHLSPRDNRERYAVGLRRVKQYRKIRALKNARKLLEKARRLIKSRTDALEVMKNKEKEPESPFANDLLSITRNIESLDLEDNRTINQVREVPAATITAPAEDRKTILNITKSIDGLNLEDNQETYQEVPEVGNITITAPADDRKIILKVDFGNGCLSSEIRGGQQHVFSVEDKQAKVDDYQAENATVPYFQTTLPIRVSGEYNGGGNIRIEDANRTIVSSASGSPNDGISEIEIN